jgi:predicted ATPase/DNA-binding XRE family transcriptional regulator
MLFGQRLRALRRDLGLSQAELADKAGCSVNTVRKLESDERRPSHELATQLAQVFELPLRDRTEFVRLARGTSTRPQPSLPAPMTRLIGREQDVAELRARLQSSGVRLLTLTGPPGIGKTRLGLQMATELQDTFRDGAAFVALAAIHDPALVLEAIAQTLGVHGTAARSLDEALFEQLRSRQLLLVLDNFEQVLPARVHVSAVLAACPRIKVIVTSRSALAIYGELVHRVPSLALPEPRRPRAAPGQRSAAETLFLERARAVRQKYATDPQDRANVAEICLRLEGLPLAIELAASHARTMSPKLLLDQLSQRLDVLAAGPTDFTPRQRSMRGALDWSYGLLHDPEQRVFATLSLFAGGATVEAIQAVSSEPDSRQVVEQLAEKSLLHVDQLVDTTRFGMLETIRAYAHDKLVTLAAPAEEHALRQRYAAYFAGFAERSQRELAGPDQIGWLQRLDADHDNVRAALGWAIEHSLAELVGRICAAMWPFWRRRGYYHEGRRWLSAALSLSPPMPPPQRAAVLNGAGVLALLQNDYATATTLLDESRELFAALGHVRGLASALSNLGWLAHDCNELSRAGALFEESLRLRRDSGDIAGEAASLDNLGMIALTERDLGKARQLFSTSVELYRRIGDTLGLAQPLSNLGWALQELGEYAQATELFTESLDLAQRVAWSRGVANNLSNLALMALYRGDYVKAGDLFVDCLAAFHELGNPRGLAEAVEGLAGVAGARSQPQEAARLFGVASALRESVGAPLLPTDRSRYESMFAAAREQLGEESWSRAWDKGRASRVDEVVAALIG